MFPFGENIAAKSPSCFEFCWLRVKSKTGSSLSWAVWAAEGDSGGDTAGAGDGWSSPRETSGIGRRSREAPALL